MSREHPVVLRFQSLFPAALGRMAMHARRTGGPLDHVERDFAARNRTLVGPDFAREVRAEIRAMKRRNRDEEVEALLRQKRKAQAKRRREAGLQDPWKASEGGPLREAILTANKEFFHATHDTPGDDVVVTYGVGKNGETVRNRLCGKKIREFEKRGRRFFEEHFPGAVRHLRLDLDEQTPHFHALLLQRTEKTSARRGKQDLIQPSSNPLLANYERAQDAAGAWFADVGLARGARSAKARREAREADIPESARRRHVSPRERREARLARQLAAEKTVAHQQAEAFLEWVMANSAREFAELTERRAAERERQAENLFKEARALSRSAADRHATTEALGRAFEVGVSAIEGKVLAHRPGKNEREPEGLKFGAAAPREKASREELAAAVRPAMAPLVRIARQIASLEAREQEADRALAEAARRARVIAAHLPDPSLPEAARLLAVAAGAEVDYSEESFPGAWAVPADADPAETQKALDGFDNRTLLERHSACLDAVLLCEEHPDLRVDFDRGRRVLEVGAKQRGLDIDTGQHDPSAAIDPERAKLHLDSELRPQRKTRRLSRQRVR
ncbi:hypothetical protein [Tranquillimonas alkanivorans]|uniref:Plasmid recombination enzyme n=1 Tax=Tranquillimonas alkanivorans TaxID=441119 RepID=A0A1I5PB87_9RHOB|nr:hypothetical protein [Tranquillimonas alkanivorans]SFP31233.1 hypothetical protein SAMN04488047_1058 [Tranquillimonas alkanivorans]